MKRGCAAHAQKHAGERAFHEIPLWSAMDPGSFKRWGCRPFNAGALLIFLSKAAEKVAVRLFNPRAMQEKFGGISPDLRRNAPGAAKSERAGLRVPKGGFLTS